MTGELPLSFEECPYKCDDGLLFDYNINGFVKCPHCSSIRDVVVGNNKVVPGFEEKRLADILGVKNKYLTTNFEFEGIILQSVFNAADKTTVEMLKRELTDVYEILVRGELPECSYCFGLGHSWAIERVAYPFLAKAYAAGLTVTKLLTIRDVQRIGKAYDLAITRSSMEAADREMSNMLHSDVCIVFIPDGASMTQMLEATGLMQTRASNGKPTIFLTCWTPQGCANLAGDYLNPDYYKARKLFIKYDDDRYTEYTNALKGGVVDNRQLSAKYSNLKNND